jgi:hypothetical protein
LVPRLPTFAALLLLSLGAGWVGGRWAVQSSPQGEIVPNPHHPSLDRTRVVPILKGVPANRQNSDVSGKAYLGIRGKEFRQGEIQGVKITEVFPDSPAAAAGLRSDHDPAPIYLRHSPKNTGHIIVGANGQSIRSEEDLGRLLALSVPGGVVKFLVTSTDGNSYEVVPVTLGAAPEAPPVVMTAAEEGAKSPTSPGEIPEGKIEEEIFLAVNLARAERGLPPLQENAQLQQAWPAAGSLATSTQTAGA